MRREIEQQDQHYSRVLSELSSLVYNILRAPPLPFSFSDLLGPAVSLISYRTSQASPSAFASLFLGISVSLMLFGSVTFVIGFFLMPFVIGLVLLFYFVGLIHKLSELGSSILWPGYVPNKDIPGTNFFPPSLLFSFDDILNSISPC